VLGRIVVQGLCAVRFGTRLLSLESVVCRSVFSVSQVLWIRSCCVCVGYSCLSKESGVERRRALIGKGRWESFGGVLLAFPLYYAKVLVRRSLDLFSGLSGIVRAPRGSLPTFVFWWFAIAGHWRSVVRCSAVRVGSVG
jgi:hypothetical protein